MFELLFPFFLIVLFILVLTIIWRNNARKYISTSTVASAYDAWTKDKLLERLWGEHIHLGFYPSEVKNIDFRKAKVQFVHELVKWSGLDKLPQGSRILDVGCGIGEVLGFLQNIMGLMLLALQLVRLKLKEHENLLLMG